MRRVHREATERVGANRLGRNGMRGHVHRVGLDGIGDGNEAWRTAKRRKQTCVGAPRSKQGSYSSGGVWRTAKRDSTGYCSSPPSTSSSLHGLLFIQPPRAPVHLASTGSCSSGLHRALLHRLLFNQPQPARSIGVLFIQRQHRGVLFIHPHRELFIQPPYNAHCSSRGSSVRSASVSSSSEGITRSGSVNSKGSIAWVQ